MQRDASGRSVKAIGTLRDITDAKRTEDKMREAAIVFEASGQGIMVDDFGTGYSSLSYLKRFPVSLVKIDRNFVRDCPHDSNDARLVEAVINMAKSLDLEVTAEGVETSEQVEFLRRLGCEYAQGYWFARPMRPADFEAYLDAAADASQASPATAPPRHAIR